jgi:hypothetical protein
MGDDPDIYRTFVLYWSPPRHGAFQDGAGLPYLGLPCPGLHHVTTILGAPLALPTGSPPKWARVIDTTDYILINIKGQAIGFIEISKKHN